MKETRLNVHLHDFIICFGACRKCQLSARHASDLYKKRGIKTSFLIGIPTLVHHEPDCASFAVTDPVLFFMAMSADPCVDVVVFDFTPKVAGETVV